MEDTLYKIGKASQLGTSHNYEKMGYVQHQFWGELRHEDRIPSKHM